MAAELVPGAATLIESLGVYLPSREVSTDEVMQGCRNKICFPLERMTGIRSRHVAGDTEFAIDLAKQAVTRCLATSRHTPGDVELLISCAIARVDGPGFHVSYEPSTAVRLKHHFGFDHAMVFDVRSACSGMFVGISIVDALIRLGTIGCGLVVSGEYITNLATTAQQEIEDLLDPRLACLTLGDAGAAVMLEAGPTDGAGFAAIDLWTLGGYAQYCVAGPTEQAHGGAIMFTEALKLTEAATRFGSGHALHTLRQAGWPAEGFQHLIMHQTSRTALTSATRAINRLLKRPVCHEGNTIDNLERCGNTATTSHFVALAEGIRKGRIRPGERTIFAISGSGLTVGTALYTFDDLPKRMGTPPGAPRPNGRPRFRSPRPSPAFPRIRISGVGTGTPGRGREERDSLTLLESAAADCLRQTSRSCNDVDLLIYAGTYRSRFVTEPAMAALLAGAMAMNATGVPENGRHTLAFDVFNGGVGVLNACYVAAQTIRAKKARTAMVVAAETENNADSFPAELLGIEETGSAMLMEEAPGSEGFRTFRFASFPEHTEAFMSYLTNREGKAYLGFVRAPDLERHYVRAVVTTAEDLLRSERIALEQVARIFPPQLCSDFIMELSAAMGVPRDRFVDVTRGNRDLFTSSLPRSLRYARDRGLVRPGDLGLMIAVGSGIQVGCALYHF
jgi:3-oxoacyl-[acyl-carrier-protein] synthase III